jgi:hypothetical protein
VSYFVDKIIAHPHLKQTYEQVLQTIYQPGDSGLVFVFGPTGVGKTTLRCRVEQQVLKDAQSDLISDRTRIPVVSVEAIAQGADKFNWRDYYQRALLALDEPLVTDKIDYEVHGIRRNAQGKLVIQYTAVPAALRHALEKCLIYRRLTAFIIDEAQHFKKMSGGRRLLDQMDSIKSLASLSGTVHVLVGTYELLALTDLSAQLSRRSVELHFPRYRSDDTGDVEIFKSVILTFQGHLPLEEEPDLVSHYDYLYEGSVGCVGVLKDWLTRSLVVALKEEQKTMTLRDLERQALPTRQRLRMAREIKEGEDLVQERAEQRAELRALLGMKPALTNDPPTPNLSPAKTQKRRRRVGQRSPVRDVVGVNE